VCCVRVPTTEGPHSHGLDPWLATPAIQTPARSSENDVLDAVWLSKVADGRTNGLNFVQPGRSRGRPRAIVAVGATFW